MSVAPSARMNETSLEKLSDAELLALMHRVYLRSRKCHAQLIRILIAVDKRRLHLKEAHPSLFEFCVGQLGMSNATAQRFSVAARLAAQFPDLIGRIERGELHMTTLVQMRNHLTPENANDLLELARGRTRFQVEELLASVAPRADAPSRMRKLPMPRTGHSVAPIERPVQPLAPERYRVLFNADRETHDDIVQARDLMRHSNPTGDLEKVFKFCVRAGVERLEGRQYARIRQRGRRSADRPEAPRTRHVPRAIRRAVFERDGARCTFHDDRGNRCPAKTLLQLHHLDLYAHDGPHSLENICVRCRAHNQFHAEEALGKAFMDRKRNNAREKRRMISASATKTDATKTDARHVKNRSNATSASKRDAANDRTAAAARGEKEPTLTSTAKPLTKTKKPRSPQARGSLERVGTNR
jgi:hypothetical protein